MKQEQSQGQDVHIVLQNLIVPPNKALLSGNKDDAISHEEWLASLEGRIMALGIVLSHALHNIDRERLVEYLEEFPPSYFRSPVLTEQQGNIFEDYFRRTINIIIKSSSMIHET